MMRRIFFFAIALLMLMPLVSATKEVKTITYFGGFVENAKRSDAIFNFPMPPDGVSQVYYVKANIRADMTGTTSRIYFYVNGQSCTPSYYDVSEKSWGYTMSFDCTNRITNVGNYSYTIDSNKNLQNIYIEWEITYKNNPSVELEQIFETVRTKFNIHGTEYQIGDSATIWLQLLDEDYQPINNAICLMDLYNPDKTIWLTDSPMLYLNNSEGIYYYDLIIGNETGVYMTNVKCNYIINQTVHYADATTVTLGSDSGSYTDTWFRDSVYHSVTTAKSGSEYKFDFYYSFNDIEIPNNYTGMSITWMGKWDEYGSHVKLTLYDWCNARWTDFLPNDITKNTPILTNHLPADTWNVSCFYQPVGNPTLLLRFNNTPYAVNSKTLYTDFVDIRLESASFGQVKEIKGSGELHVSEYPSSSFISSTEYSANEMGQFVQQFFISEAGRLKPVNDGNCYGTFYYPNKTIFINNTEFFYKNGTNGLYYYNTTIPNVIGVYSIDGNCARHGIKTYSSATFHVSQWAEGLMNMTINGTLINEYYLLFAGGTEYVANEESTLTVQFMRTVAGNPSPINDAEWCRGNIHYPDMTIWKSNLNFSYLSGSNALYYNRSILPSIYGVYTIDAQCKKGGVNTYVSHTFHVVPNISQQIHDMNQSLFGKLYNIQGELIDIEDAIIDVNFTMYDHLKQVNQSIWSKLYRIQDEIAELGVNVTNISISIVANMTTMPKEVYLYFQKAEERLIYNHDYCLNNVTKRKEILIEKCVAGDCWNQTRNEDTICQWGCDPETNECKPAPWLNWLIIIGIIIGIIILVIFINWLIHKFEWFGVK